MGYYCWSGARFPNCLCHGAMQSVEWPFGYMFFLFDIRYPLSLGLSSLRSMHSGQYFEICAGRHNVFCSECWAKIVSPGQARHTSPSTAHLGYNTSHYKCTLYTDWGLTHDSDHKLSIHKKHLWNFKVFPIRKNLRNTNNMLSRLGSVKLRSKSTHPIECITTFLVLSLVVSEWCNAFTSSLVHSKVHVCIYICKSRGEKWQNCVYNLSKMVLTQYAYRYVLSTCHYYCEMVNFNNVR